MLHAIAGAAGAVGGEGFSAFTAGTIVATPSTNGSQRMAVLLREEEQVCGYDAGKRERQKSR